jgi:AmmeMemoRadiSam system protein B
MANTGSPAGAYALGKALAQTAELCASEVLLVASTDLHHIADYDTVVRKDREVVDALRSFDMTRIERVLMQPGCSVCGRIPMLSVLSAAKSLGSDRVRVLHQTNSGDVTGQRSPGQYTVGYLAAAAVDSSF